MTDINFLVCPLLAQKYETSDLQEPKAGPWVMLVILLQLRKQAERWNCLK